MPDNNSAKNHIVPDLTVDKTDKPFIKRAVSFVWKHMSKFLPDRIFIPIYYRHNTGRRLNLKNPVTFNEKLQWMKLYNRNPMNTIMVDKYAVQQYVADTIGEEYLIPLLGVWDRFDEIDFSKLPDQFVLKCTHDSFSVTVCRDKSTLDLNELRDRYAKYLKRNYYYLSREWQYKNVKPRIIAQKYMEEEQYGQLRDYKFFCFDGEPKLVQVDYDKFTDPRRNLYTLEWQYVNAVICYPSDPDIIIERPKTLEAMLDLARKLSKGLPHVRVDLFCVEDKIYFGELTFMNEGGTGTYSPESFGVEMGSWLKLPIQQQ